MSWSQKQETPLAEHRFLLASVIILMVFSVLTIRLWYVQVYKGDYYKKISENNRIRKIEIPAPRGMIFDREGNVILGNRPFFDLVYIPQYVQNKETTLKLLSQIMHVPVLNFEKMLKTNQGRPKFLPITLMRNLSTHEVSLVESNKVFLPGIEINVAPRRDYNVDTPAHLVGYIGEIGSADLKRLNLETPDNLYLPGDLIGKQGLEARWERFLRGKRGHRLIQVDAFGRQTRSLEKEGWSFPEEGAIPGSDLTLTIDMELQKAAKNAFQGKYGAVVVLNPSNGEILAMLSSPDYDPNIYQEILSVEKWQTLIADPYKPLFDKTTGGTFAPGSVYKSVIALAALQEGILTPNKTFNCHGSFELGKDVFHCHYRPGHGTVNLEKAMMLSCDVFFFNLGMELGIDRIAKYAKALGLGSKLGVNLNKEEPGLIPTTSWKKMTTHSGWNLGDIPSIAIGQGANLLSPMQIANLYATIANGGSIYRPHIVKRVRNHIGEVVQEIKPEVLRKVDAISSENFKLLRDVLQQVVMGPRGTGAKAQVEGVTVAGKTGSAQVVSLKKNRNRKTAVSMKWQEHAIFAAFSPVENAEIAVAIVSENDQVGTGGAVAAPIAQKIIAAYWDLKKKRQELAKAATTTNSIVK